MHSVEKYDYAIKLFGYEGLLRRRDVTVSIKRDTKLL